MTRQAYSAKDGIGLRNGSSAPLKNSGIGLLPTPNAKLKLNDVFHTPHITHNFPSVYRFARGNRRSLIFYSTGFFSTGVQALQGPINLKVFPVIKLGNCDKMFKNVELWVDK